MLTESDIEVGKLYKGKKRRQDPFEGKHDDKIVLYISPDRTRVQYDSYFIRDGRHYPTTSMQSFLNWAKENISDEQ